MGEETVVDQNGGFIRHIEAEPACGDDSPDDGAGIDGFSLARFGVQLQETPAKAYPPRWNECDDLEVRNEWAQIIWAGPRYLRCTRMECHSLVTHGMIAQGGCWCGNRRLTVALRLTTEEKAMLKRGYYPLVPWEVEQIRPVLPTGQTMPGWGKEEWKKRYA